MPTPILLVPAYKPDVSLEWVLDTRILNRFEKIFVVNDGSPKDFDEIFERLAKNPQISILKHAVNLGKGAALKTGFNSILVAEEDGSRKISIVTADADGQHAIADVMAVANAISSEAEVLVLGGRSFQQGVPLRSKVGNLVTRKVFRFLTGLSINDTQTGLRGVPQQMVGPLLKCSANGYEFEMEMLILAKDLQIPIKEIPISTIYINNNSGSHFNPLFDSFKIYFVLLRYLTSSFSAAVVDYIVFLFFWSMGLPLWACVSLGRLVSVLLNFSLNYKFVFKQEGELAKSILKYLTLVVISGISTYIFTNYFLTKLNIQPPVGKIIAEVCIFFVNFLIQREWVFNKRKLT